MKSVSGFIILLTCISIFATIVFLSTWEIKPPTKSVEKVIPNSRFLK